MSGDKIARDYYFLYSEEKDEENQIPHCDYYFLPRCKGIGSTCVALGVCLAMALVFMICTARTIPPQIHGVSVQTMNLPKRREREEQVLGLETLPTKCMIHMTKALSTKCMTHMTRGREQRSKEETMNRIEERRRLTGPGSHPPSCKSKCGRCVPCKAVHVPIHPGRKRPLEYYPEAWRCKCGNKLYMP